MTDEQLLDTICKIVSCDYETQAECYSAGNNCRFCKKQYIERVHSDGYKIPTCHKSKGQLINYCFDKEGNPLRVAGIKQLYGPEIAQYFTDNGHA